MGTRGVVVLACLVSSSVAHAQFSVDTLADSGVGSLRDAIVNSTANTNTIVISVHGTIVLSSALPALGHTTTITGPGADQLTVQGSATASPVFTTSGTITLSKITITGGANNSGNGGGIAVTSGSLVLLDSVVTGNSAMIGGGIFANGTLTIRRSTVTANVGASAVHAGGDATVL